jgi:putative ABC transport system permease protein
MFRLGELKQDLSYTFRMMRKYPGFTAAACSTLVLGIGATTAVFSVVEAVLLRPLPYMEPERLVHVLANDPQDARAGVAYRSFEAWRSQNRTLADVAAYYRNSGWSRVTIGAGVEPQSVQAGFTSANLFSVMGVAPMLGRVFDEAEEKRREPVAVLSNAIWQRDFGGEPGVLGKTIEVDGRAFTIIGVMPRAFQFPARETMLWLPVTTNRYWLDRPQRDDLHARGYYMRWNLVARLRPRATPDTARADLAAIAGRLARGDPDWNMGLGIKVAPLGVEVAGDAKLGLLVVLGSASLVLLIACSNVANLMLARGAVRARELAVRTALGATHGRIVRQVLTESLLLVSWSAAGAVFLALAATRLLVRFGPTDLPRLDETRIDGWVLCFTLGVSALAALLSGLPPAWRAGHSDPISALKAGGRTATTARIRTGGLLVVSEFALAVVLLAGAGLLLRSLREVERIDLGFRPDRVLTMHIRHPDGTPMSRQIAFQDDLLSRFRALPGIRFAGGIDGLFELDHPPLNSLRVVEGMQPERDRSRPLTWTTVSGEYFRAMGVALVAGRYFSDRDTANSPLVAIVDEGMARRYWPNEDPLGKRFKGQDARGRNDDWLTVVGVVKSARRQGLEQEPTPHVYEWSGQAGPAADWVIRTSGDPGRLAGLVRAAVREAEPHAVISRVMSMEEQIELQTSARRFRTWLLGLFAALAMLLSTVGIYGVISYATAQRTQEVGVRMALGAQRSSILGMILRQGMALAAAGLGVGMAAAMASTRLISGLLFGVTPTDPVTFAAVAVILFGVAGCATLLPAVRATQVDPLTALRDE